ncbi:MAG: hypothetical protein FCKEOINB_02197 [Nitrosomonas sp.]|nr:hypothetical protein [Nitrosomonas sp.]
MTGNQTCVSCAHSEPAIDDEAVPYLQCRRFPPQFGVVDGEMVRAWAQVDESDWCGEHQPREEGAR